MRAVEGMRALLPGGGGATRPASASVESRLEVLERDLAEVRTRVNALFFAVLAAAVMGVLGRAALG